jgi:TonB family protein
MQPSSPGHPDPGRFSPLDEPDRLARPFSISVAVHLGLAGLLLVGTVFKKQAIPMGVDSPGMGVAVTAVKTIPIPRKEGQINHLANNTESVVPQEKVLKLSQQKPVKPLEPLKAIELPDKVPPKTVPKPASPVQYRPKQEYVKNQVFSRTPEALKSAQVGIQGGGGVGIGPSSPFGSQFGAYAQQIRDLIAQKWNQAGVNASPSARATITFQIRRDGSIANVQIADASGSYTLDNSARRAVFDANPLPPLPPGFNRPEADVELWFQIRR